MSEESVEAALARVADNRTCPKCGHRGPIGRDFGWREMGDGTIRSQSHCYTCRSRPELDAMAANGLVEVVSRRPYTVRRP